MSAATLREEIITEFRSAHNADRVYQSVYPAGAPLAGQPMPWDTPAGSVYHPTKAFAECLANAVIAETGGTGGKVYQVHNQTLETVSLSANAAGNITINETLFIGNGTLPEIPRRLEVFEESELTGESIPVARFTAHTTGEPNADLFGVRLEFETESRWCGPESVRVGYLDYRSGGFYFSDIVHARSGVDLWNASLDMDGAYMISGGGYLNIGADRIYLNATTGVYVSNVANFGSATYAGIGVYGGDGLTAFRTKAEILSDIGGEASGTAAGLVAAHAALTATHNLGESAFHPDAYFALFGHLHTGVYDPAGSAATVQSNLTDHAALTTAAHGGIVASTDSRLTDARTPTPHALNSASHTVSGLTPGHFLKALTATTFGFVAHGLTYADVGAEQSGVAAGLLAGHVAAADPHTVYVLRSGSLTQLTTRNHNDLQNLNGAADVQHLTAAQAAALHASVTVSDTASIDFTLTGQALSAVAIFGTTAGTVCQGSDARLSDARPASDVYAWAKAAVKPTYTYTEVNAIGGSGTLSTIALFTPDGARIGDSPLTVSGNNVYNINGGLIFGANTPTATARIYIGDAITTHAIYGVLDDSTIDNVGDILLGHASFNCNVKLQGTHNIDHHASFQAYPHMDSTGDLAVMRGYHSILTQTAGRIVNVIHFQADDIVQSGGVADSQDGAYIGSLSKAAANCGVRIMYIPNTVANYAIKSLSAAQSLITGKLGLNISLPEEQLHCRGTAKFGRSGDDLRAIVLNAAGGVAQIYNNIGTPFIDAQISYTGGDHWLGANSGTAGAGAQLFLQGSSGNLGLGRTPTAGYRLDIAAASAYAMLASTTTTSSTFWVIKNSGNGAFIGKDRSTGGGIVTGSVGYSTVIRDADGKPIHFCVGNVIGITLDASNNIGLGITTPQDRLQVTGNVRIDSRSRAVSGEIDKLIFSKEHLTLTGYYYNQAELRSYTSNGYAGGLNIYTNKNAGGGSYTSTLAMVVSDTQSVGIGRTPSAGYTLDVNGAQALALVESTTGTNATFLALRNTGGTCYIGRESSAGGAFLGGSPAYATVIRSSNAYPLCFGVNNTVVMTIVEGGSVGIGVAPTAAMLEVNGSVKCTLAALATAATVYAVSDGGILKTRTAAQVRSDIGAAGGAGTTNIVPMWNNTTGTLTDTKINIVTATDNLWIPYSLMTIGENIPGDAVLRFVGGAVASSGAYHWMTGRDVANAAVNWYCGVNIFDSNGTFEIKTGTLEGMVLAPITGWCGIGVDPPIAKLHVKHYNFNGSTNPGILFEGYQSSQAAAMPVVQIKGMWGVASTAHLFRVNSYTDAAGFNVLHNGNTGVGTLTPFAKFSVNGGCHIGGDSDPGDNNLAVDGNTSVSGNISANNATLNGTLSSSGLGLGDGYALAWGSSSIVGYSATYMAFSVNASQALKLVPGGVENLKVISGDAYTTAITSYSPVVTAAGGTPPTFTSQSGYYKTFGKLVYFWYVLDGDTAVDGANMYDTYLSLPVAAKATLVTMSAKIGDGDYYSVSTGKSITLRLVTSTTVKMIRDGGTALMNTDFAGGGGGRWVYVSGCYEAA